MGYYTRYELRVDDGKVEEHSKKVQKLSGYGTTLFADEVKWYDHENDMTLYSKEHPSTLFTLEGWGEEQGDIWKKYFKGGKMQEARARIVFDPPEL